MRAALFTRLGYSEADALRLFERTGGDLRAPHDIGQTIDGYEYGEEWRDNYFVQSVRSSIWSSRITCIDAAILAYGLLEIFIPELPRSLLVMHRRDPATQEECGHCLALYRLPTGRIGAFSKSHYAGLGHREPVFSDEESIAISYARAYVGMGLQPLYFGVTTLEKVAPDIDWRLDPDALNDLSDRLQSAYEYGFSVE